MAIADFNNDGKLDLIINNNNDTPTLYLNNIVKSGNFAAFQLIGAKSNRDAIGAVVRLSISGKTMMRQVEAGSGYASESMLPVHFGLGAADKIEAVEIRWANGATQRFDQTQTAAWVNKQMRIEEGSTEVKEISPRTNNAIPNIVAARKKTAKSPM